mgnify:CR=1 FL=1
MVLSWSFSVVSVAGTSRLFSYFDSITQVQKEINLPLILRQGFLYVMIAALYKKIMPILPPALPLPLLRPCRPQ